MMAHVIEAAASGRARCRGCGKRIVKDDLRFGERMPNAFGEGEMTLWFHPLCAAYKRPEPLLELLESSSPSPEADAWRAAAESSRTHRRLPRISGVQRASSGRAKCRCCRVAIPKDSWRIPLVYYEEGRFEPSGFIHLGCSKEYFETTDIVAQLHHFSPDLSEDDLTWIESGLNPTDEG